MSTRAVIVTKRCPMYDDACAARVAAQISALYPTAESGPFDAMALIEERCGRFTRGAHVGKVRGWAEIRVAESGGWLARGPGYMNGRVVRPGTVVGVAITAFDGRTYLEVSR